MMKDTMLRKLEQLQQRFSFFESLRLQRTSNSLQITSFGQTEKAVFGFAAAAAVAWKVSSYNVSYLLASKRMSEEHHN